MVKFWAKNREFHIYYHITVFCGIFVTIPMARYAHVAMYRLSTYICVHMVTVNCEYIVQKVKFWAKT